MPLGRLALYVTNFVTIVTFCYEVSRETLEAPPLDAPEAAGPGPNRSGARTEPPKLP